MSQALATLGLEKPATLSDVKARWRELAKIHHPDVGGDPAQFEVYLLAYRAALAQSTAPVRCKECGGTGKILICGGFSSVKMVCTVCGGTGETRNS